MAAAALNRRGFLGTAISALAGSSFLRHLPAAAAPIPMTDVGMRVTGLTAFPEGTFLLDSGSLELGLVRDVVAHGDNEFQVFAETFENVVSLGWVKAK